jgi:hydroxymethylbilane synthase
MRERLTIGTRGSNLALKQAELAREALITAYPELVVEYKIIKTEGDGNERPIPLDTVGKGWFTKEIEVELLAGTVDIAAHSLKDLPEVLPEGLKLGAFLQREDARDVLVSIGNKKLQELAVYARVGTDSARRKVQLLALRPDLTVESIRGNVNTRLHKLDEGLYDAVVLALAGLKRLGMENRVAQYFTTTEITPAPGQGIITLETRADDQELNELLAKISDTHATVAAKIERAFAQEVAGGCKSPTGAYATIDHANNIHLIAMLGDDSGIERGEASGSLEEAEQLGRSLARKLRNNLANHA